MVINKKHQKTLATITCYVSDVTLMLWLYFKATNYNDYLHKAKVAVNSPDFQIQLYHVLLQSLTFSLLLFLLAQTIVYILFWRNLRGAKIYLKYFAVFGAALSLMIVLNSTLFALLPFLFYCFGYYAFASLIEPRALPVTLEERQIPPQ